MRLIDADALIDTMAIIAKKFAKTDAQKALMGRVMYILEHKPNVPKEEIERLEQAIEVIEWIIGKVLEGDDDPN